MPPEVYYQDFLQYSQENTVLKSLLNKVAGRKADVFLQILGNF